MNSVGVFFSAINISHAALMRLPQISRNTQNRMAEDILPQISQIYTDIYSHRIHGTHRTICLHLCKSVKSVGVFFWAINFCVFREFRGSFLFSNKLLPRSLNEAPTEFTEFTEQFACICVNPWNLWEFLLNNKFLWILWILWEFLLSNKLLPRSLNEAPTDFTEHTEQNGRGYSPTDFTDLHRYLLPQNSRNTQNILLTSV